MVGCLRDTGVSRFARRRKGKEYGEAWRRFRLAEAWMEEGGDYGAFQGDESDSEFIHVPPCVDLPVRW
jgi:hypothetical protein